MSRIVLPLGVPLIAIRLLNDLMTRPAALDRWLARFL